MKKFNKVGEEKFNKRGSKMKILNYENGNITICFDDNHSYTIQITYGQFKTGSIKNPFSKTVCGVGYLGVGVYKATINGKPTKHYKAWYSMINRCYNLKVQERNPTYKNCTVDSRWHNFQVFSKWYDNEFKWYEDNAKLQGYPFKSERYNIDKDILVKGNKHYSPETSCITPQFVNLLIKRSKKRDGLSTGVHYVHNDNPYTEPLNSYYVIISNNRETEYLGVFDDLEEGSDVYCTKKEKIIQEVALKYKLFLPKHIFEALMNYRVEIDD